MKTKQVLAIVVLTLALVVWPAGSAAAAPLGTAFTYQGRLMDANAVADGLYDLQFKLFDDPNIVIGNQIGNDVNVPDIDVIDGYFTVELDFGDGVYTGAARWLEIGVRPGDMNDPNDYALLEPRQELTPVPYALYAKLADSINVPLLLFGSLDAPGAIIAGHNTGSCLSDGVYGYSSCGSGVYASSESGKGVHGHSVDGYAGYFTGPKNYFEGNVGIGTTSPESALTIGGADTKILFKEGTNPAVSLYYDGKGKSGTSNLLHIRRELSGNEGNIMTLRLDGNVGIGTTSPEFKLTLDDDGGIIAKGTFDRGTALTVSGPGTRLIWYPRKAAFRAGDVIGDQWDRTNIGRWSTAMGCDTVASGSCSFAMGADTEASGDYSTAMGSSTTASGYVSTAIGKETEASGGYSIAMGAFSTASENYSTAIGGWATAGGSSSTAIGTDSTAGGNYSAAMGHGTTASGKSSIAIGEYVTADANNAIVIGCGYNSNRLVNNIEDSLMVGFGSGSRTPTLFVNSQRVGINTKTPQGTLDVNGSIYQRGGALHADYVFEPSYELESIDEHSAYMWRNKHLPAIPKAKIDEDGKEIVEVGAHRKGIVEELEKAHIYIEQLHERIRLLEEENVEISALRHQNEKMQARLGTMEVLVAKLAGSQDGGR